MIRDPTTHEPPAAAALPLGFPRLRTVLWFSPATATFGFFAGLSLVAVCVWAVFRAAADPAALDPFDFLSVAVLLFGAVWSARGGLRHVQRLLTPRCAMRLTNSGVELHRALSGPARIPYRAIERIEIERFQDRPGAYTAITFTRLVLHRFDGKPMRIQTRLIEGGLFATARFAAALRKRVAEEAAQRVSRVA